MQFGESMLKWKVTLYQALFSLHLAIFEKNYVSEGFTE